MPDLWSWGCRVDLSVKCCQLSRKEFPTWTAVVCAGTNTCVRSRSFCSNWPIFNIFHWEQSFAKRTVPIRSFVPLSCPSEGLGSVSGRILTHIISWQNVSFMGNICSPHWAFDGDLKWQEGSWSNNVLQHPSHWPGLFPHDCFYFHH